MDCLPLADDVITLEGGMASSSEKPGTEWLTCNSEESSDPAVMDVTENNPLDVPSDVAEVEVTEEQLQVEQAMQIKEWEICKYYFSCAGKRNLFFCFLLATACTLLSKGSGTYPTTLMRSHC